MTREFIPLIPQPTSTKGGTGAFTLNAATTIVLPAADDPVALNADYFAATQLQAEIEALTGLALAIERRATPLRMNNVIMLLRAGRDVDTFSPDLTDLPQAGAEAYHLGITPTEIIIVAADGAGIFYGVQTLRQLVRTQGSRLPSLSIDDAPAMAYRGVMLDVSRFKVPTVAALKELVETMAHYKLNELQLYTEHTFQFPSHPRIGAGCGSLSSEDMIELDVWCRQRHVRLVPNLQSFGHMAHILAIPAYKPLAETRVGWSISPALEGSYKLLGEMYADMLPAFTASDFNIGCDETYDLGMGQSKSMADEMGLGRVYMAHILRLRELAAGLGKRIQVWGDIILHHPELLPELPQDIVWLDWHYEAQDTYHSPQAFAEAGRTFYVCPGTSSWNTLFPRIDNANANIRYLIRDGVAAGAVGMLNTDWGDGGHYQPLGQSYYSYIYGAEQAWTGATTDDESFDQKLGPLYFGDMSGEIVRAMRRLGSATTLPGVYRGNGSNTVLALFDEPLVGKTVIGSREDQPGRPVEAIPLRSLAEMKAAGEYAAQIFESAAASSPDPQTLREMAFSARLIAYAADKVQLGQRLQARWPELCNDAVCLAELNGYVARLVILKEQLAAFRVEFERLWLARARRSEIEVSLGHYDRALARFDAAIAWLQSQRAALATGGELDRDMSSYDGWNYLALWDRGTLHRDINALEA